MNRNKAESLLKKYVKNDKMLYHSYASEVVMRALAKKLGRDRNFSLSIDGRSKTTRHHFIEIDENRKGRLIINSSRR